MQNWLRDNNVPFDESMTRKELYLIILRTKPPKKYVVDELMKEHGQEIVRLPTLSLSTGKKDHLEEENVREFIISLGEESSDSEISDSDDELMTGIEPIIYSEDDS
ncbi:hypothetical protein ACJJTC_010682 [Scirpophaga incertulas]